jgi:hypothetical protein
MIRALLIAVTAFFLAPAAARAADMVTVPSQPGQTRTITWSGTIPPSGTGTATSDCNGRPASEIDEHDIRIVAPAGGYGAVTMTATFSIHWTPADNLHDEVLTVVNKDVDPTGGGEQEGQTSNEVGSSDGSSDTETVTGTDLPTATYGALSCGFVNVAPQPYTGTLVIATKAVQPPLPAAPSQGMGFSAAVPADPQRDEGEPLVEIAKDGTTYTCGPTGFSNAADYAQVSTDGGRQFHLLGEPPRGQQAPGGGGDCALATAPVKNAQNAFNYSYSGLGPLTNFATATSSDNGRDLTPSPSSGATIPGVDRQWETFLDANTVLLDYNQQAPRQVVVQKSTDGGLTFGVRVPASAPDPDFPGPLRSLPASQNPRHNGQPVAYFPWSVEHDIDLSVSFDGGATWTTCRAAEAPGQPTLFTTADSDRDGNVYLAYGENATFHTFETAIRNADLAKCDQDLSKNPTKDPGFSQPVQVDRDAVGTTVFPWLTAGGAPGRVAVAFYGSQTDGDPNQGDFKGTWNVYVNQSLNALGGGATFSQRKATTHPVHYDSICLNGLGCDVSGGDRSLADFFAIDYDPSRGILQVVYDTTYKRPGDAEGTVATPTVVTQTSGPSNGGGSVTASHPPTLRGSSTDATGDAIADYSSSVPPRNSQPEPAADFRSVRIDRAAAPGFRVTMHVADLSDAALAKAVADTASQRILYVFRWFNGYRYAAAVAKWSPTAGWSFGYNDFVAGSAQCGSSSGKCLQYPGDQPIPGRVDQATGTISLDVPLARLRTLSGGEGPNQRPAQVQSTAGSREFDGTAFTLSDDSPTGGTDQSFLYPLDNTPSMDFLVPGGTTASAGAGGARGVSGLTAGSCVSAITHAGVAPRGRGARIRFRRRAGTGRVRIDVFQESAGRRALRPRAVATFHRRKGFTWSGRANRHERRVRNGILLVRMISHGRSGNTDIRRFVLRRTHARLHHRPPVARHPRCSGRLRYFAVGRPVLGGSKARRLRMAAAVGRTSRVTLTVRAGGHVVKRFRTTVRGGHTLKRRLAARRVHRRGDVKVTVAVRAAGKRVRATRTTLRL